MSAFATVFVLVCALDAVYSPKPKDDNCTTQIKCSPLTCNGCCVSCRGANLNCNCCPCSTANIVTSTSTSTTPNRTEEPRNTTTLGTPTASSFATEPVNTSVSDTTIQSSSTTLLSSATATATSSSISTAAEQLVRSHDHQVVAVVVSVVLVAAVVAGVVAVVVWWRLKRESKSRGEAENAANIRMSGVNGSSNTNKDNEVATSRKDTQDGITRGSDSRKSEHVYTHIDSVTNLRPKSTIEGENSVYNEPDDVVDCKLLTAPVQDRPYFLIQNPSMEHDARQQQLASSPCVYSLANTASDNTDTPQYLILEDETKVLSQNKADGIQYFILDEEAATDESNNQNSVAIHDAHEYSALDSSARAQTSAEGDAEYTPLHGKTGPRPKIPAKIHRGNEYSDLDPSSRTKKSSCRGADYTALEYNPLAYTATDNVDSTNGPMHKGVNEKQSQAFCPQPSNEQNKDGQYFILEVDTADGGKDQKQNGQYFVLEKESNDKDREVKVGQCFALEKNATTTNEPKPDNQYFVLEEVATDCNKINPLVHAATGTANGAIGYMH